MVQFSPLGSPFHELKNIKIKNEKTLLYSYSNSAHLISSFETVGTLCSFSVVPVQFCSDRGAPTTVSLTILARLLPGNTTTKGGQVV